MSVQEHTTQNPDPAQLQQALDAARLELERVQERYEESIFSSCLDGQDVFGDIPRIRDNLNHPAEAAVAQKMANFRSALCAVACIRAEDTSGRQYDDRHRYFSEGERGGILRERLTAVLGRSCTGVLFTRKDEYLVALLNPAEPCPRPEETMAELAGALQQELSSVERQEQLLLFITVSAVFSGLDQLSQAYTQAVQLMRYAELFSERAPVLTYYDYQSSGHQILGSIPPDQVLNRLISNLAQGLYDDACELMLMMVTNYTMVDLAHVGFVRQYTELLFSLADALCRPDRHEEVPSWHAPPNETLRFTSIETIQNDIIEYFSRLQQPTVSGADAIVAYIHEHHCDPDLDVSALSRVFSMSLSSLSRSFKRAMGTGPLDYLHRVRIDAAKPILIHTDCTLTQVAEQVGYLSAWTLTRVFKKLEGMTPTQYRSTFTEKE